MYAPIIRRHVKRKKIVKSNGLPMFENFSHYEKIPYQIMCTIFHHAITRVHVMIHVHAFKRKIIVRNFVIVAVIAAIGSVDAVARHNAIQNNVHAIWLCVNVIQICVHHAVQINLMYRKLHVKMLVFNVAYTSIY